MSVCNLWEVVAETSLVDAALARASKSSSANTFADIACLADLESCRAPVGNGFCKVVKANRYVLSSAPLAKCGILFQAKAMKFARMLITSSYLENEGSCCILAATCRIGNLIARFVRAPLEIRFGRSETVRILLMK